LSRLRATLSTAPIDQAIQSHVAVADRAIRKALDVCNALGKSGDYAPAYVSRVRRDLQNALGAVEHVRRVSPRFDLSDPDFQPTSPYERPLAPLAPLAPEDTDGDETPEQPAAVTVEDEDGS
jgi:hypothetical protein